MIGPFARARRRLHARGLLATRTLPRPVISVGNLTVGGTGKTPMIRFLACWLREDGIRAAVLSRGYGRTSRGVVWASGEGRPRAGEVGDEPALLAASLPGIPVVVGESRFEAGMAVLSRTDVDMFLLDDGFQHLSLARDLDILLVDARRGLGNGLTLPLGPLREPPDHARYADALVVTRCRDLPEGRRTAAAVPAAHGAPRAFSRIVPTAQVDPDGNVEPLFPAGTEIAAFSGLADNAQFRDTLVGLGYSVRTFLSFGDHHRYDDGDIRRIRDGSRGLAVVTTEKDMVRLPSALPFPLTAIRIGVEFLEGWEGLSRLVRESASGRRD